MEVIVIPFSDKPNRNGHVYTKECLEDIVKQFDERTKEMYGQIGYPDDSPGFGLVEHPSHEITELYINEKNLSLVANIELLDNEWGELAQKLIDTNGGVFRSRSLGSVNGDGQIKIDKLISFDLISKDDDAFGEENNPNEDD